MMVHLNDKNTHSNEGKIFIQTSARNSKWNARKVEIDSSVLLFSSSVSDWLFHFVTYLLPTFRVKLPHRSFKIPDTEVI